jgi:hypothetical protein
MPDAPGHCPFCGDELQVRRLECPHCHVAIEGAFTLGRFQRLTPDQLAFLEVFIRNRGNISRMESDLGKSYPTIRNMLDDLIRALGYEVRDDAEVAAEAAEAAERRRQVLEQLSRGELTSEQAIKQLRR